MSDFTGSVQRRGIIIRCGRVNMGTTIGYLSERGGFFRKNLKNLQKQSQYGILLYVTYKEMCGKELLYQMESFFVNMY